MYKFDRFGLDTIFKTQRSDATFKRPNNGIFGFEKNQTVFYLRICSMEHPLIAKLHLF
jgi:hypothetical protein